MLIPQKIYMKQGMVSQGFLEASMRDVAEVACEPQVFEQTATKQRGPSSTVSPHPVLWLPQSKQCPIPAAARQGCPVWGKLEEGRGAESSSPPSGMPGAAVVAPAASHGAQAVNCTHLGVNITMQGVGKKVHRELSNREFSDYEACLDIF